MATVIDSFMITLGLDPTDFNKGIDEADKKTESFASKLTKKEQQPPPLSFRLVQL